MRGRRAEEKWEVEADVDQCWYLGREWGRVTDFGLVREVGCTHADQWSGSTAVGAPGLAHGLVIIHGHSKIGSKREALTTVRNTIDCVRLL